MHNSMFLHNSAALPAFVEFQRLLADSQKWRVAITNRIFYSYWSILHLSFVPWKIARDRFNIQLPEGKISEVDQALSSSSPKLYRHEIYLNNFICLAFPANEILFAYNYTCLKGKVSIHICTSRKQAPCPFFRNLPKNKSRNKTEKRATNKKNNYIWCYLYKERCTDLIPVKYELHQSLLLQILERTVPLEKRRWTKYLNW